MKNKILSGLICLLLILGVFSGCAPTPPNKFVLIENTSNFDCSFELISSKKCNNKYYYPDKFTYYDIKYFINKDFPQETNEYRIYVFRQKTCANCDYSEIQNWQQVSSFV